MNFTLEIARALAREKTFLEAEIKIARNANEHSSPRGFSRKDREIHALLFSKSNSRSFSHSLLRINERQELSEVKSNEAIKAVELDHFYRITDKYRIAEIRR